MSDGERGTRALAAAAFREAARGREPPAGLRILDGPLAGCRLPLGTEETLGRGAAASLRLPDPGASRRHLRLRLAAGGVRAEDLGSKNGWTLNGRRRGGARLLRPGDVIAVGTTRLLLEFRVPRPAPAPSPSPEPAPATPGPARARAVRVAAAILLALAAAAASQALRGG